MGNAWEKFKRDVNAVTDDQIEEATKESQYIIDREWVEAVTAWKKAGKPRRELKERSDAQSPTACKGQSVDDGRSCQYCLRRSALLPPPKAPD